MVGLALIFIFLGSSLAYASDKKLGLGIIIGEPTGFTPKYWLSPRTAVDFGLTYSFGDYFLIYSDYLYHWLGAIPAKERFFKELSLYIGGGGVLFVGSSTARADRRGFTNNGVSSIGLGMRIPLGAEWRPKDPPIGVFVELAPGLGIAPAVYAFLQGGIGMRWYF